VKKYWTSNKYKIQNSRHAKRELRRRIKSKEKLKKKRRALDGLNQFERRDYHDLNERYKDFIKISAPKDFSFINNTEEVSVFIDKLNRQYEQKNKVFILLENVETVSYGAIVVLLSIMVKFKASNIDFNGNFPSNLEARKIIEQSGFFENLYKRFKDEERYSIHPKSNTIHTHAWKDVDSELGAEIVENASKTIWGESRRCQGVQRALLELMQNTNNHAKIGKEREKHWWLSVNHSKEENKVSFSFVDFGVGVFKSLDNKSEKSKFFGWKEKLAKAFNYSGNVELLKLILEGKLHKTVTNKHFRGKGLPGIREVLKRNQISNLHIITNDVYSNVSKGEYKRISKSFSGTFVYWELTKENSNCHG
jgi:hypothetical protein